jgi:hypothetical protein
MLVMFLGQAYISTGLYMKLEGELTKNLHTLFVVQSNKIKLAQGALLKLTSLRRKSFINN